MSENKTLIEMGRRAKAASRKMAAASSADKNMALKAMARALAENQDGILAANKADVDAAGSKGISRAMLDRLTLTPQRIAAMADGILEVAALRDPVGEIVEGIVRPNGLRVQKTRVPLGVVGIIYEARPNVTSTRPRSVLNRGTPQS